MGWRCAICGGDDYADGSEITCTSCGEIDAGGNIRSEVQFEETGTGGTRAVGQTVTDDGHVIGGGYLQGQSSKEITINRARKKINELGDQIRLDHDLKEAALKYYGLALGKRLTQGRRSELVVAACVYIACRASNTAHMMIDLCDAIQTSVFVLSRVYTRISEALNVYTPTVDPSVFVERFASKLGFGGKTYEVTQTAARLVASMKRDWLHAGRRPSGLCGAALVVAARLHNFNRTLADVVKVVRTSGSTIDKRLKELKDTAIGRVPVEKFKDPSFRDHLDGEERDPPCFTQARLGKPKRKWGKKVTQELADLERQIEAALEEKQKNILCNQLTQEDMEEDASELYPPFKEDSLPELSAASLGIKKSVQELFGSKKIMPPKNKDRRKRLNKRDKAAIQEITGISADIIVDEDSDDAENGSDEELDLTGLDEEEIRECILTPKEVKNKHALWSKANAEYLKELKEKERKRKLEDIEELTSKDPKPKRKKRVTNKNRKEANTAGEAIEAMLIEKKISSKVNYDVLNRMLESEIDPTPPSSPAEEIAIAESPTRPKSRIRNKTTKAFDNKFSHLSNMMKTLRKSLSGDKKWTNTEIKISDIEEQQETIQEGGEMVEMEEEQASVECPFIAEETVEQSFDDEEDEDDDIVEDNYNNHQDNYNDYQDEAWCDDYDE